MQNILTTQSTSLPLVTTFHSVPIVDPDCVDKSIVQVWAWLEFKARSESGTVHGENSTPRKVPKGTCCQQGFVIAKALGGKGLRKMMRKGNEILKWIINKISSHVSRPAAQLGLKAGLPWNWPFFHDATKYTKCGDVMAASRRFFVLGSVPISALRIPLKRHSDGSSRQKCSMRHSECRQHKVLFL